MELLVGICLFSLAILPLIWLSTSQTKGAYSVGKHMMAGQLAASYLDNMLKLPFDECLKKIKSLKGKKEKVVKDGALGSDLIDLNKMIENLESDTAEQNMKASFKYFYFKYDCDESLVSKKILRIDIEVFYRVEEGEPKSERSAKLSAIKYGDRND